MNVFRMVMCRFCSRRFPASYYAEFVCPSCARKQVVARLRERLSSDHFFGASPAPFVGRFGYPYVNVGVLSPGEVSNAELYDAPESWASQGLSISEVVDYRASLVNMRTKSAIKGSSMISGIVKEVAMSSSPVDVEAFFSKKPGISISFSPYTAPTGPAVELVKAGIASNPKVHFKVEKVHSDTDLKAAEALNYLYRNEFDVNFLGRILSVGAVGLKMNRKLVPTRFSITATDDIVGRNLISKVRDFPSVNEPSVFFGGYLGNYFAVVFLPDVWSYELFEAYVRGSDFTTDFESCYGRKAYAVSTSGGYYAARLPVLEKLSGMRRQASVLVIRMITDEYLLPLGVWVVREAVRKAMRSSPIVFSSGELALKYVESLVARKFGYRHIQKIFGSSRILAAGKQAKLANFLG